MSLRIQYGKNTPMSFQESIRFSRECPYKIRYKDFANDDITPLHYADTLEIAVCCDTTGEIMVGSQAIPIRGNMVYVVTPGTVHATKIKKGAGHIFVLQVSLSELSAFLNVEAILQQCGKTLTTASCLFLDFSRVHQLVQEMIRCDSLPFIRLRGFLEVFELLSHQLPDRERENCSIPCHPNSNLHHILRWTETHFTERLSLERAAAQVGFTKTYFCTWFKSNTGVTYNHYLNNVRINHACRVLAQKSSISSACYSSGFQDISYFTQIFRKTQGCTPKEYLRNAVKEQEP